MSDDTDDTGKIAIDVRVNGRSVTTVIPIQETAAEFLRDRLGLTGTKVSCDMQVCGACSVLVDDVPVSACTYLAVDLDGRTVRTVEGLATNDDLSPLQRAFLQRYAYQCGFCTSGFLMMATSLLERNPHPTEEQVVEYLDGNICRCTGYRPIVDAILDVAAVSP